MSDPQPKPKKTRREVVQSIGKSLCNEHYPAGQLAELRRMDVRRGHASSNGTFWRLIVEDLEPHGLVDGYADDTAVQRWMALFQGLATHGDHRSKYRLGLALAKAEVSEVRVVRLLRARDASLLALIGPIAHQLRSKGEAVDWADFADLIFTQDTNRAESVRRDIASDFYRQLPKKKQDD